MPQYLKAILFLYISMCGITTHAGPWFTGPVLAGAGHTIPKGHTNFEFYALDAFTNGQIDRKGHVHHIPLFKSLVFNPILSHGFTDWLDVQISAPYTFNSTRGVHYHRLTDSLAGVGLQLAEQDRSPWLPDIRFFFQETFPTGSYELLNPAFLGTDATGLGSYRSLFALNLQYLQEIYESHYLRTRLVLSQQITSIVTVAGFNSFGGTRTTLGKVNPGSEQNVDLAFEYTLTQNWVAVMEGYYSTGKATRFNGIMDMVADDIGNTALSGDYFEYGIVPAIEYNFTGNIGIIGGIWFPVKGSNTSRFTTYVFALNAFF